MKRLVALLSLIGAILAPVGGWVATPEAQVSCPGMNETKLAPVIGHQTITVADTVVGLIVPATAKIAIIIIETAAIRYLDNGTDPTVDLGMLVQAGTSIVVCSPSANFRMVRDTGTSATATVSYYGVR